MMTRDCTCRAERFRGRHFHLCPVVTGEVMFAARAAAANDSDSWARDLARHYLKVNRYGKFIVPPAAAVAALDNAARYLELDNPKEAAFLVGVAKLILTETELLTEAPSR